MTRRARYTTLAILATVILGAGGFGGRTWMRGRANPRTKPGNSLSFTMDAARHAFNKECKSCGFMDRVSAGFNEVSLAHKPTIVGGEGTTADEFPGVGALMLNGTTSCTATCLTRFTVLTAAHCVFGKPATSLSFKLGTNVTDRAPGIAVGGYLLPTTDVEPAVGAYDNATRDNDIALVYLTSAVNTTTSPVAPDASMSAFAALNGQMLNFVGYGFNDPAGNGAGIQRHVKLRVHGETGNRIAYGAINSSICFGDSGGPAFDATKRIVAVTSDTNQCQSGRSTWVAPFATWIEKHRF